MAVGNEHIPVIDFSLFSTDPEECARQVGIATQGIGFFYLKNHGVDQGLIDRMFAQSEKFYAQDMSEKVKHAIKLHNSGYATFMTEKLGANINGDNKEAYNIGANVAEGEYTDAFSMYDSATREEVIKFFKDLYGLARQLLQCFAIALKIPEQDGGKYYFDKRHIWEEPSGTILRFLHYPQQECDPGVLAAGAHTDYGSCTLLLQNRIPGLEVEVNRNQPNAAWVSAPVIPGTILVNIGDLLEYWTNGLFKSTKHQVAFHEMQRTSPRYSIACFVHPNNNVLLDPIPSPVIAQQAQPRIHQGSGTMTANDHLLNKLRATYDLTD